MKFSTCSLLSLAAPAPVLAGVLSGVFSSDDAPQHVIGGAVDDRAAFQCDLPPPVSPDGDGLPSATEVFSGPKALSLQVQRHAAVVQVPTVSYDDMGDVGEDPRWDVFFDLHRVLERLYPTVHKRMSLTKVNTLGLVYTIEGTDAALKPIMFTAHQDVVPVPEPAAWKYPPFAGHYDGEWLWGRGAVDDKDSLTGVLSCMEALLQNASWTPRRGIVLAFGFDEETGGMRGAGPIATYLEERFGRDSMVLLIDEGGSGMEVVGGDTLYALPGITEKGHADMQYELHMRGGHSSMPLPHTGIGIAAAIITTLEANPFAPTLIPNSPLHHHFVCRARYSPDEDPEITKLVRDGDLAALTTLLASTSPALQFLMQTSQAVDVISGGLKINAMPEKVNIGVNYRVAPHNSLDELKERTIKLLEPILEQYKITLHAFGKAPIKYGTDARDARNGVHAAYDVDYNATLILTADQPTPPAPLTPTTGAVWDLFSGTIQDTFAIEGGRVVPVGDIMNGNTDTRHYLNLTANVIRFSPMRWEWIANFHAIDEGLHMEGHMEALRFYYNMIRNFDAADI